MIRRLRLSNFTAFEQADFDFSPGLNLIIGENATGKSHLLKVAYATTWTVGKSFAGVPTAFPPREEALNPFLGIKLVGVFKPNLLGRLVRQGGAQSECKVEVHFTDDVGSVAFGFNTSAESKVQIYELPKKELAATPIYFPTRELLTLGQGFLALYESHFLMFDETWYDTVLRLAFPVTKGDVFKSLRPQLEPLEDALNGKLESDDTGRFYLQTGETKLEIHLVAEGHRKVAMLARLISNRSLARGGVLFWDEPEANLNPKLIKSIARSILHLCQNGIQVFAATHSLFLMRELDILLKGTDFPNVPSRFFGLHRTHSGIDVEQGDSIDDIGDIASLDEELAQSHRYLESSNE